MNPVVVRKKSGLPDISLVTDPLHLQCYTPLCKYLNETKKLAVTEHLLSQFAHDILLFMETRFGKKQASSALSEKMVKIPFSLFRDFRVSGGLCTVFEVAATHATISAWVATNLMDDTNIESGVRLLLDIEKSLVQRGLIRRPVFFFGSSVLEQPHADKLVRELSSIAVARGGRVTDSQQEASFIVLWDDEVDGTLERELQEEYIRPLEIRPNEGSGVALVHWWYHPDSYDEWIPSQDVQCADVPDAGRYSSLYQKSGFYDPQSSAAAASSQPATYVCCRYLRDVLDFNEWGNLSDYEMDKPFEGGAAEAESAGGSVSASARKGRGKKRGIDRRQSGLQRQQQNGIQQNSVVLQAVSATERMLQDLPPPSVHDAASQFNNWNHEAGAPHSGHSLNVVDVMANQPCQMSVEAAQDVTRQQVKTEGEEDGGDAQQGTKRKREGSEAGPGHDQEGGGESSLCKRAALNPAIQDNLAAGGLMDRAVLNDPPASSDVSSQLLLTSPLMPVWFIGDSISSVEMKYVADLIVSSSEPLDSDSVFALTQKSGQRYLAVRNSIVHLYHHNPNVFLTATECRRKLAGDVSYIIRIHDFLDTFGVINYSPELKSVVRNPKSSIFYSSCPGNVPQAGNSSSEFSPKSKPNMWSEKLDQALLEAVTAAMSAVSSTAQTMDVDIDDETGVEGVSHEVGGVNWSRVAEEVAARAEERRRAQFTSVACLVRFTEMTLGSSAATDSEVPGGSDSSLSSRAHKFVAGGSSSSKHVRALASVVTASAAELLKVPHVQAIARAIETALKGNNVTVYPGAVAALSTGAALVSSAAQAEAVAHIARAESCLDDYISLRLAVLEKRMGLVGDIEDALQVERERAELDRHDLQVERAQHASFVQAETQMSMF